MSNSTQLTPVGYSPAATLKRPIDTWISLDMVPEHRTLNKARERFERAQREFAAACEVLDEHVAALQSSCRHEYVDRKEFDEDYSDGDGRSGAFVLVQKVCVHCRKTQARPPGRPSQICYMCWAPMKNEGVEPGQGEHYHHYECPACKHHVITM